MARLPGLEPSHVVSNDDWWTPRELFDALDVEFDLDVAAPPGGVPWIPATRHWSIHEDGLTQPWHGTIWLNPPYSKPAAWINRWLDIRCEGMALVPSDHSVAWWQRAARQTDGLCLLAGRMRFVRPDNSNVTSARFPSTLFAIGEYYCQAIERADLGFWTVRHG